MVKSDRLQDGRGDLEEIPKQKPSTFFICFHFGVCADLLSKTLRISVLGCKLRQKLLLCT